MQIPGLHNAEMVDDDEIRRRADRLKLARARRFEKATTAAEYLGMAYSTLAHHEAGTRGIKRGELIRYARVYGVELAWLDYGTGPMIKGGPTEESEETRLIRQALDLLKAGAANPPARENKVGTSSKSGIQKGRRRDR